MRHWLRGSTVTLAVAAAAVSVVNTLSITPLSHINITDPTIQAHHEYDDLSI
jgi:hypothetical protein